MLGLIFKSAIRLKIEEAYLVGFRVGVKLGIQIGRYRAGDKGIIISARVEQQVEKIIKDSKF